MITSEVLLKKDNEGDFNIIKRYKDKTIIDKEFAYYNTYYQGTDKVGLLEFKQTNDDENQSLWTESP